MVALQPKIGTRSSIMTNSISNIKQEMVDPHALTMSICAEACAHLAAPELAEKFGVSHTAILPRLKEMGKVSKLLSLVQRKMTEFEHRHRMDTWMTPLSSRRFEWLNKVVNED